jgi:hypothetical protein
LTWHLAHRTKSAAFIALVNLVLYLTFPDRLYFTPIGGILSKMYANTMLMVLNSRIEKFGRGSYTISSSAQFHPGSVGDTTLQQGSSVTVVIKAGRAILAEEVR